MLSRFFATQKQIKILQDEITELKHTVNQQTIKLERLTKDEKEFLDLVYEKVRYELTRKMPGINHADLYKNGQGSKYRGKIIKSRKQEIEEQENTAFRINLEKNTEKRKKIDENVKKFIKTTGVAEYVADPHVKNKPKQ